MDFNFESKLWAEKICQQFESICQDVDGFVNKVLHLLFLFPAHCVGMSSIIDTILWPKTWEHSNKRIKGSYFHNIRLNDMSHSIGYPHFLYVI